jgi:hypothetical protein
MEVVPSTGETVWHVHVPESVVYRAERFFLVPPIEADGEDGGRVQVSPSSPLAIRVWNTHYTHEEAPATATVSVSGQRVLAGTKILLPPMWHPYTLQVQLPQPCAPGPVDMSVAVELDGFDIVAHHTLICVVVC